MNRSYYEEVLIVRVHPEILRGQGLPDELLDEKTLWPKRYRSIVDLEEHLHRNGTRIIKFFLHLSKDEQRKRLLEVWAVAPPSDFPNNAAGTWGPEDAQGLAQGRNWPLPTELGRPCKKKGKNSRFTKT